MERRWRLGDDLHAEDNLLDGITFRNLIDAVRCNCPVVTPHAVTKELREILDSRMQDLRFLLETNMDVIMQEALKGRGK